MTKKYNGETLIVDEFIKDPIRDNTKIFFSHFGRYYYASKVLDIRPSDLVLDASCGNGYGTFSIAQKCKHIYGLDINEEYLELAQNNYGSDNITFTTYKDFYENYQNILADKILTIETLEHIPKDQINNFVENLLSKLKLGGSLFATIPLGNNEPSTYNPFHLNEMSIDVIYNMFSSHFQMINIEINSFINSFGYECQYCYLICKNKK